MARRSPPPPAADPDVGEPPAGWAHDTLEEEPRCGRRAGRDADRLAAAVLEFLRDQPFGDGAALRARMATVGRRRDVIAGVHVLTFPAANAREWPLLVVTGVETGFVPYRSATKATVGDEEARLLHVAVTRPADRLVITWAARRGGYRRQPSPLIAELDTAEGVEMAPPPVELVGRHRVAAAADSSGSPRGAT